MNMPAKKLPSPATVPDLLEMPEDDRYELVAGELIAKEAAAGPHGRAQVKLSAALDPFHRRQGSSEDRPGGWWFATEALVLFAPDQVRRPDVAGWRRERMPDLPVDIPITAIPDWICEILSPSNASTDTILKMALYRDAQVRHYWILDPQRETLTVYRWTTEGYLFVLGARRGERVHAEPFEELDLPVGMFFGDDDEGALVRKGR